MHGRLRNARHDQEALRPVYTINALQFLRKENYADKEIVTNNYGSIQDQSLQDWQLLTKHGATRWQHALLWIN